MGHPRQRKSLSELRRRRGTIDPAPAVLIVCEGEKTEPHYFSRLARHLGLHTVEVVPAEGSAPATIVADAAGRKRTRKRDAKRSPVLVPYDHVYCIFDVDEHPGIPSALEMARANQVSVALTNPCFEYWLLLHFERIGATNLTRHRARQELNKHLEGYEKGGNYWSELQENVDRAIEHADDLHRSQWAIDASDPTKVMECCPSTGVHLLVKLLRQIARSR